jgi:hypothetical protein
MKRLLVCLALLIPLEARAAAWTQPRGSWQIITGAVLSDADRSFDAGGNASFPERFQRLLLTTDTEYGITNRLTLLVRTETANAHVRAGNATPTNALDNAVEVGARYRLMRPHWLAKDDVLSIEVSGRKAGAFNFAYSANATSGGEDAGIRLLYGSGFRVAHHYAFIDLEAGERWLSHPRPSQTAIDLTAGMWLAPRWMVMLQSFNLVSGPARAPYVYYRTHKLEASAVWRMTRRLSLQGGVFFSPAGQNALDERGLCLSLWADL